MFKIGVQTIIKEIKEIHPEYISIIKSGTFYSVYGKDACILSYLFEYQLKKIKDTITCGFPIASINKVKAKLENKKINYLIIDRRTGYTIDEKMEFNNLNTYNKYYKESKNYANNKLKINEIYNYLEENAKLKELNLILNEIEKIINEARKI